MSMLDYLKTEQTIDIRSLPRFQFDNYSVFEGDDTDNGQSFKVKVTTDKRLIIVGICQEIDAYDLACMTIAQRGSWLAIVSGEINTYLISCKQPGKNSGLSYNLSWDSVCYRYNSKRFAQRPKLFGNVNGVIGISWANKRYAIDKNGKILGNGISVKS